MQIIWARTVLACLTFCLIFAGDAQRTAANGGVPPSGRPTPNPLASARQTNPTNPKPDQKTTPTPTSTEVVRLKVEPLTIEFATTDDFHSDTKRIVISDADSSGKWTFVRIKEIDKRLELKVASDQLNNQTARTGERLAPGQWFGFKNSIDLDLTLFGYGDSRTGVAVLQLDKGSARLPEDSAKAAGDAIKDKKIEPALSWNDLITVTWRAVEAGSSESWTFTSKLIAWGVGVALALLLLAILIKFTHPIDRLMNQIAGSLHYRWKGLDSPWKPKAASPPTNRDLGRLEAANSHSGGIDARKLSYEVVQELKTSLNEQNTLVSNVRQELASRIDNVESRITSSLKNVRSELEPLFNSHSQSTAEHLEKQLWQVQKTIEKQDHELREAIDGVRVQGQNEILGHMHEQDQQIRNSLSDILRKFEEKKEPDLTYARMLGVVLGKNVTTLNEDSFQEFGDAINGFFREQVPQADERLRELRQRADNINASLAELLRKTSSLNTDAASELAPHIDRARQIGNELNSVYSQLRSRQIDLFLSDLHISVATHESARDAFLEELGSALKREIEKLRDPHAYFETQLRQLATSEIVGVADVCDKKFQNGPGQNSEIETPLGRLFDQSGLKPILPKHLDEYQPALHDFIEIVSAPHSSNNKKIARVVSRGFFYEQDSRSDLLRKAGVAIYG
jgi:hypothetical protein